MTRVRTHWRRTKYGYQQVRSHYRRSPKTRSKRNFFISKNGFFLASGLSKKHGPYLTTGYRQGPVKLKTSVGLQGHKISGSIKPARKTEIGIEKNLTFNKTNVFVKHKKNKFNL
jgi:hypothetical protein